MGGLKAIEMQIALPRTQIAGKLQDQLQQRTNVTQGHLAQKEIKDQIRKQQTVTENEKTGKKRLTNDEEQSSEEKRQIKSSMKNSSTEDTLSDEPREKHPYKGVHFDVKW